MKLRPFVVVLGLVAPLLALAAGSSAIGDIVRAQIIINQALNVVAKLKEAQAAAGGGAARPEPVAPTPLTDKSGKFFSPYDESGNLTEWANKAVGAQVGAAVGAKAGEKAGGVVLSKVPFGGLMAGAAKKKGKELGAVTAVGGYDFIKQTSPHSFTRLEDLALYLHLTYASSPDYAKGFAAAMAIYPDLEKTYEATVKGAYGGR
ncbi:MAG TPA: hypothetical protein VG734_27355 [Lacunisphaera sp.]|nr:hypothetical protein [Lacunisphaera sp.]